MTASELLQQPWFDQLTRLALLLTAATVAYFIARYGIVAAVRRLVHASESTWDDALVRSEVFLRLAHVAPALVAYFGTEFIDDLEPDLLLVIQRVSVAVILLVVARATGALLTALNDIYTERADNAHRPIRATCRS